MANSEVTTLAQATANNTAHTTSTLVKVEARVIEVVCESIHAKDLDKILKEALELTPNRPQFASYTYAPGNKQYYLWQLMEHNSQCTNIIPIVMYNIYTEILDLIMD